jgi:hypothetical protein
MSEELSNPTRFMKYYTNLLNDKNATGKYKPDAASNHNRLLQGDVNEEQEVTVDGCLFEFISKGPESMIAVDGVTGAFSSSNRLVVKNSIFRYNNFSSPINGVSFILFYFV